MKYCKPELRDLAGLSVNAQCSTGSNASFLAGCGTGGGANQVTNCENGSDAANPPSSCYNVGTQPTTFCNNGTTVGTQCITGDLPDL